MQHLYGWGVLHIVKIAALREPLAPHARAEQRAAPAPWVAWTERQRGPAKADSKIYPHVDNGPPLKAIPAAGHLEAAPPAAQVTP